MTKVFAALAGLLIISCSDDGVSVPPDIPIQTLLTTPDTIVVENRKMYLSTFLWRDFQPVSPKDGKPLIALVYVTGVDTMQLPITISADAVWIVYNNQAWKSWLVNQDIPPADVKQNCLVKIARDGPKWGPYIYVDVIVRVRNGDGSSQLLRASEQYIGRSD